MTLFFTIITTGITVMNALQMQYLAYLLLLIGYVYGLKMDSIINKNKNNWILAYFIDEIEMIQKNNNE
jgi:hypothetical protein